MIKEIQGINIYSKSSDWLGRALTNPSYAIKYKSEYDILPKNEKLNKPENYILPYSRFKWAIRKFGEKCSAKKVWGYSVEAWYFANSENLNQKEKEILMKELIICKLQTYPKLISEIDNRGGLEFLKLCNHQVTGNINWEGEGENSNFIKVLIQAYKNIKGVILQEAIQEALWKTVELDNFVEFQIKK